MSPIHRAGVLASQSLAPTAPAPSPSLPVVSSLSVTSGVPAGGTTTILSGVNFTGVTGVKFGSVAAASFTFNSDSSISATSPAESSGVVNVTVTTAVGTSATSSANQFTFTSSGIVSPNAPSAIASLFTSNPVFATEWATLGTTFPSTQWNPNNGGIGNPFVSAGGNVTSLSTNRGMGVIPSSLTGAGNSSPGLNLAVDSSGNGIQVDTYHGLGANAFTFTPQSFASGNAYYFESSILLPGDSGGYYNWPAWWLTAVNISSTIAEIDIFEAFTNLQYHLEYGTHYGGSYPAFNNPGGQGASQTSWANVSRTYGALVYADQVTYVYNGANVGTQSNGSVNPPYANIALGQQMYMLLNNAGKHNYAMASVNMIVNWTRVWKNF